MMMFMRRLIGVDLWSFKQRVEHIAQYVQLPEPPELGPKAKSLPEHERLPPLLIINIQLPMKQVRAPLVLLIAPSLHII